MLLLCSIVMQLFTVKGDMTPGVALKQKYSAYTGNTTLNGYVNTLEVSYYSSKIKEYEEKGYISAKKDIPVNLSQLTTSDNNVINLQKYKDIENVFVWDKNTQAIEFEVNVLEEALYEIEANYYMLEGQSNAGIRSLSIDGQTPFVEASNIIFTRMFRDDGEPVVNSIGDETRPKQMEVSGWRTTRFIDSTGMALNPFKFHLTKGKHKIKIEYIEQDMAISSIKLAVPTVIETYEAIKQQYIKNGYKDSTKTIEFEAENTAIEKSDPTLRRESDADPTVTPRSIVVRKLNTLGGYRWRKGNQSITWSFDVPETGLYKIGLHSLQAWNDGLPSYRQIAIDGKVPFKELDQYSFDYNSSWKLVELQDQQRQAYKFYLTQGKHTITMTVKYGPIVEVIESLNQDSMLLSKITMDIIKIAGSNPDPNYDYAFFESIPTLEENMKTLSKSLQYKYDYLGSLSDKVPAMANNFLTIKMQLDSMIKDPYTIAARMGDLTTAQSSLGTWYLNLQSQPLNIDCFKVGSPNERWVYKKAAIFQKLATMLTNFLVSFTKDYDNVGGTLSQQVAVNETIDVWISRGTEWAEVIKEMADEDFTTKTGIKINLNVLPASQLAAGTVNALMLSITAGKAPDVALGVAVTAPVDFAIRDTVYDLSKMQGYDKVAAQFVDGILLPYEYNGGVYAIPETMNFNVMFYRKDIMAELGLPVPNTREELYNYVLPVLYQNGLEFSYSKDFTQILFQHGGSFYTVDGMRSALDTPEAYKAFLEYCQMYTNYGVPKEANFYNRFRSGEMPLGIGNFGLYMQLMVAAPELAGKWAIAPIPGTLSEDGQIDRSCGGLTGEGDIILKQSEHPQEAWEFLKWWSSAEVQTRFAREVEAIMGAEARWNTANVEAFTSLSWKEQDLEVLNEQWQWTRETPNVLGGYFTARHITNAWTTAVVSGGNVRDALETAVKEINRELKMKQEEYQVFGQNGAIKE